MLRTRKMSLKTLFLHKSELTSNEVSLGIKYKKPQLIGSDARKVPQKEESRRHQRGLQTWKSLL